MYPNEAVIDFINQNVVPLQVPLDQQPMASDFKNMDSSVTCS